MMKRAFDLALALALILPLSPLILLIGIIIRLQSPGPIFFHGKRVGRHGKTFRIYKFRSMVLNADKLGGPSTSDDDPRITRIGRFMRRHKLDELPQIINVLKGEMSFVGPRPEVAVYVALFTEEEKAILRVRPGITDWASLWNRDEGAVLAGEADPEKAYLEKIRPEKVRLQLKYVRERSLRVDLAILSETASSVVGAFTRKMLRRVKASEAEPEPVRKPAAAPAPEPVRELTHA